MNSFCCIDKHIIFLSQKVNHNYQRIRLFMMFQGAAAMDMFIDPFPQKRVIHASIGSVIKFQLQMKKYKFFLIE